MPPELQAAIYSIALLIGGGIAVGFVKRFRALSGQVNASDEVQQKHTQAIQKYAQDLQDLQTLLDTERRSARENRQQLEAFQRRIEALDNTNRELERNNSFGQGRLTEQSAIFGKQLSDQANDIAFLRQTIAERDTQIVTLTKIVEDFKKLQRDNVEQHTMDQRTIEGLRRELQKATEDVVKLTKRVDELKAQVDEMQQEISRRDIELADKDRQISELKARAETAEKLAAELKVRLEARPAIVIEAPAPTSPETAPIAPEVTL